MRCCAMLTLLLTVCVLGVIAWVLQQVPMPNPFRAVAYGILVIILLLILFRVLGGGEIPTLLR
jgi:hypothetical protein